MDKIDINLYSRQISTYGMDIMIKLNNIKVIIIGLRGLGVEISKNIILTGVNEISIMIIFVKFLISHQIFIYLRRMSIKKEEMMLALKV